MPVFCVWHTIEIWKPVGQIVSDSDRWPAVISCTVLICRSCRYLCSDFLLMRLYSTFKLPIWMMIIFENCLLWDQKFSLMKWYFLISTTAHGFINFLKSRHKLYDTITLILLYLSTQRSAKMVFILQYLSWYQFSWWAGY